MSPYCLKVAVALRRATFARAHTGSQQQRGRYRMTRKALHSAMLEVGLYFEKGWSADHIARFTFRLHRRRIRAQEEAGRARIAARAPEAERLMVTYPIEKPKAEPRAGYAVTPSKAGARTANALLVERVRAQLSKRLSRSEKREGLGQECSECAEPATGWIHIDRELNGQRVTHWYATCDAHRSPEALEKVAKARAR